MRYLMITLKSYTKYLPMRISVKDSTVIRKIYRTHGPTLFKY